MRPARSIPHTSKRGSTKHIRRLLPFRDNWRSSIRSSSGSKRNLGFYRLRANRSSKRPGERAFHPAVRAAALRPCPLALAFPRRGCYFPRPLFHGTEPRRPRLKPARFSRSDEGRNDSSEQLFPILASETVRNSATPSHQPPQPVKNGDEKISIFWRVFGGTVVSIVALVVITAYQG